MIIANKIKFGILSKKNIRAKFNLNKGNLIIEKYQLE